jgi:DNA-binding GntR family transcriptional regulator
MVQTGPKPLANSRTLVERATSRLREEILSDVMLPGDRVHIDDAAARLGMSVVPVREALRSLVAEGLVVAIPQRGYRVSPVSDDDLEDVYRLRIVLDPMATGLAVPRMTQTEHAELGEALDGLLQAYRDDDRNLHRIEHRRFHFAIYNACGSPWLIRILDLLWTNSYRYQRISSRHRGSLKDRALEHQRILEACIQRDPELAALLMRKHVELTLASVLRSSTPWEDLAH